VTVPGWPGAFGRPNLPSPKDGNTNSSDYFDYDPQCSSGPAPSGADVATVVNTPGVCFFVPNSSVTIAVAPNSECQDGTTDTIKGTNGQTLGPFTFTISITLNQSNPLIACSLVRPTDHKQAWVIKDGTGTVAGTTAGDYCPQMSAAGWQPQ